MKYLRVNYRKTGGKMVGGELESIFIFLRETIQHDSATGRVVTFSMQGYGCPVWVFPYVGSELPAGYPLTMCAYRTSCNANTSLVYMTCSGATGSINSLAATISVVYNFIALIGSR